MIYYKINCLYNNEKNKASVEKIVLKTFQEEIPSIYYSDKSKSEYKKFVDNAEYVYRDLFNFPKRNV